MEGIFDEAIVVPQRRESCLPFLLVGTGDGASPLPGGIGSHLKHSTLPFGKHGIVEGSPSLQMSPDAFGLPLIYLQGQFPQKRRRLSRRFLFGFPPPMLLLLAPPL